MTKKITIVLGSMILIAGATFGGYSVVKNNIAVAQASTCTSNPEKDLKGTLLGNGKAKITNTSDDCSYHIGLASYKAYKSGDLDDQVLFDSQTGYIAPNSTVTYSVNTPSCAYQIDAFYGDIIIHLSDSNMYRTRLLDDNKAFSAPFCKDTPPPTPQPATIKVIKTVINDNGGTKQVSDFALFVGSERVTSGVAKTVAPGTYTVREDNLSGYQAGNWGGDCSSNGSVSVQAGQNKTCTITNNDIPAVVPTLNGSCVANPTSVNVNQTVNWSATATGGTGSYSYVWSGWDNLSGTSATVQKSYNYAGTKPSQVVITSGSRSITVNCTTVVVQPQEPAAPSAYCTANQSSVAIGSSVTFTAHPSNGNGSYTYSWNGTDGLNGSNQSVSQTYYSAGTKTATVVVTSNGKSVTVQCSTNVYQTYSDLTGACYVNLSTANINDVVTWNATASGGNGNYTYSWNGWDNLSGNGSQVSKQYSYAGQKSGTVTISSNGQTITKTCYMNVVQPSVNLSGSCAVYANSMYVGDTVNWSASATNGNGNYSYSWTGTDNLYSNNQAFSTTYNTVGQKYATVTITSNGQSVSQTCTVNIIARPSNVTLTSTPVPPTVGGVYLSQVPYTGIGSNGKIILFVLGLFAWSAAVAYFIISRKAKKQGLTSSASFSGMPSTLIPRNDFFNTTV